MVPLERDVAESSQSITPSFPIFLQHSQKYDRLCKVSKDSNHAAGSERSFETIKLYFSFDPFYSDDSLILRKDCFFNYSCHKFSIIIIHRFKKKCKWGKFDDEYLHVSLICSEWIRQLFIEVRLLLHPRGNVLFILRSVFFIR